MNDDGGRTALCDKLLALLPEEGRVETAIEGLALRPVSTGRARRRSAFTGPCWPDLLAACGRLLDLPAAPEKIAILAERLMLFEGHNAGEAMKIGLRRPALACGLMPN